MNEECGYAAEWQSEWKGLHHLHTEKTCTGDTGAPEKKKEQNEIKRHNTKQSRGWQK